MAGRMSDAALLVVTSHVIITSFTPNAFRPCWQVKRYSSDVWSVRDTSDPESGRGQDGKQATVQALCSIQQWKAPARRATEVLRSRR